MHCVADGVAHSNRGLVVNRRDFLAASALVSVAAPELLARAYAQPTPFDRAIVRQMARDLAAKPYKAPLAKGLTLRAA